jgi:hypothetical protein
LCKSVANSASKLGVLEVISKTASDYVDGTFTIVRSNKRSNIINLTLPIVVEITEVLLDTLELDGESN